MTNILRIQFAQFKTTLKQGLQTLAVSFLCSQYLVLGMLSTGIMICLLFSSYYVIPLIYLAWIVYDKDSCNKGSHLKMWYRKLAIWRYCAEYFPVTLLKTVDLDPNENYICGYHPHGVMGLAANINFATEGTEFSKKFPGLTSRVVTINLNMWMPLLREVMMLNGFCSANRESLEWIVSKNGKGNVAVIVVGGFRESLDAVQGKMELTLQNRKGFVKIALKHGVSLVPIISFGENEVFTQKERSDASLIKRIHRRLSRFFGIAPLFFHGRLGFLPHRKPINTIVGKPLKVPKIVNPTEEDVNKYHTLYVESLCHLFHSNRKQFAEDPDMEIVIK